MRLRTRILTHAVLLFLLSQAASAASLPWVNSLRGLAYALGWLMMVLMGVKWIIADSPNDRAEAKKGMIYIVIGLLVVTSACNLLCMYCKNASNSLGGPGSFTCDLDSYCGSGFSAGCT